MKKPELTFTKLLLIVLGVIVALIIGLNSSAVGMEESHVKMMEIVPDHAQSLALDLVKQVGKEVIAHINAQI